MSSDSLIVNPEWTRSNQNGQITKEQESSLRTKLGGLPGWLTIAIMAVLFVLVTILGGKTLTQSTPLALIAAVAVILVSFAITALLGGLLASRRMVGISVEQVPGQVIWKNNQYTAVAGGRALEPVTDDFNLQPGDYTFFLLRGSKYLLSAQPAASATAFSTNAPAAPHVDLNSIKALLGQPIDFDPQLEPERAAQHLAQLKLAMQNLNAVNPDSVNPQEAADLLRRLTEQVMRLMKGQRFQNLAQLAHQAEVVAQPKLDHDGLIQLTRALEQVGVRHPNALDANRAGRQTAGQRVALTKEVSSNLFWAVGVGIAWVVFSTLLLKKSDWRGLLAVSGMFLVILVMLVSSIRKELFDLMNGGVQIEEGWVTKYTAQSSGRNQRTYYYYRVNEISLSVSSHAYAALLEGSYRVYLLPNTKALVNLDPL